MDKQTKLAEAFGYMEQGMNAHAAAVKAGLAPQHLYVAIKKRRLTERCPCCSSMVEPGKINREVLK